jgi:hypothetical protein
MTVPKSLFILNANGILGDAISISIPSSDGPLSMFIMWSHKFNPLGKFKIEVEALTMPQKAIIVRIVGNAMTKIQRY